MFVKDKKYKSSMLRNMVQAISGKQGQNKLEKNRKERESVYDLLPPPPTEG